MFKRWVWAACFVLIVTWALPGAVFGLSKDRWTNEKPYGVFFNSYDPNFYTGFAPRVQERERVKIHMGKGNQVRVRMILSDKAIDNYLIDQVARHDLYQEVIDKKVIKLTSNLSWESYHQKVMDEKLHDLVKKKGEMDEKAWRDLNLATMDKLVPGRLYHIQKDFDKMADAFAQLLKNSPKPGNLQGKLNLINDFFPHRIFLHELTPSQDAAFGELVDLAKSGDMTAFRSKAEPFFDSITNGIYTVKNGKLDYYELTTIYPAGTYDKTTTHNGQVMPMYTTTGIWTLIPRKHGKGITGMVDYISSAGYYGMMPMLPYQYGGGIAYNAIHNPGISCWIGGHHLLPKSWRKVTTDSRSGKPYNRVAITSRGPVSHGCTRLNPGHLTEFREMLPSTSQGMEGIMHYRSPSHTYDVFDLKGDGNDQVMGVQYYIAFRHTKSRVAQQIWAQNNRKDFYTWLYGKDLNFASLGEASFNEVYDYKFKKRKALQGKKYENLKLYEAPYEPEYLQFYVIKGVNKLSKQGMDFNRELRRVGYGHQIDRKKLLLE